MEQWCGEANHDSDPYLCSSLKIMANSNRVGLVLAPRIVRSYLYRSPLECINMTTVSI